jgi:hypothetical protein
LNGNRQRGHCQVTPKIETGLEITEKIRYHNGITGCLFRLKYQLFTPTAAWGIPGTVYGIVFQFFTGGGFGGGFSSVETLFAVITANERNGDRFIF